MKPTKRSLLQSRRLKHVDYSAAGAYFITINTAGQQHFFGQVRDGIVQHSPAG